MLLTRHILHLSPFDINTLKKLHEKGKDRQTEGQTFRLLDQSGPRADSVKSVDPGSNEADHLELNQINMC